ncbi:DUF1877 family protein [Dermacoccus nishinomiyaensis]|uniref:DUF1877 family protein n=1 Tax=Dermacoccus TaxID=57495 RepID=UPI001AA1C6EF|nr:DUF1877 family protein [Dermacoccus sp. NHGro5]MBO1757969.1 YfbM family protein [Dermacoccus sp. NHGro5]
MGMIWTAYRMDDTEAQRLVTDLTSTGDAPLQALETLVKIDDERMLDVDKAWHALERLYKQAHAPSPISEGRVPDSEDVVVGHVTPARVTAIAAAMGRITPSILRKGYDAKKFTRDEIYPDIWDEDDVLDVYVMPYDAELREFYAKAAEADEAVIWQLN